MKAKGCKEAWTETNLKRLERGQWGSDKSWKRKSFGEVDNEDVQETVIFYRLCWVCLQ